MTTVEDQLDMMMEARDGMIVCDDGRRVPSPDQVRSAKALLQRFDRSRRGGGIREPWTEGHAMAMTLLVVAAEATQ